MSRIISEALLNVKVFIPQTTPYLRKISKTLYDTKSLNEKRQDKRKKYDLEPFHIDDLVWVDTYTISST